MKYEYYCKACNDKTEVVHGMNESPLVVCAKCNLPMIKLISPPLVVFKGDNWADKARKKAP